MVVQTDFFLCQIKILHLGSFERPYIVSLKKSIVICCFQHLLPWKQSKMATKQPFQKNPRGNTALSVTLNVVIV